MVDYLHGVETIEETSGTTQIADVKTSVILLVGTAPIHLVDSADRPPVNALVLVSSSDDYAQFGPDFSTGYSIPQELAAHGLYKAGLVFVVNVFDPAVHKTDIVEATLAATLNTIVLAHQDITVATVKHVASPDVLGVEGTDYTLDRQNGIITFLTGGILHGDTTAKVAYSYANPSAVTGTNVIGTVSGGGVRSGLQCAYDAISRFGFGPKIIIAPGFSATKTVADAMAAVAQKPIRAVAYTDVTPATTVAAAITGRTPGNSPDLSSVDGRSTCVFPHAYRSDGRLVPWSGHRAFVRAATDRDFGFWFSASNKPLLGLSKAEITITASLTDENSDTNKLNAAGISTIFATFGKGLRVWGNRSLAFPGESTIDTFEAVLRTRDALEEAIEQYAGDKIDLPITQAFIDGVLADVNEYINILIGRGAIAPGSFAYVDPTKNTSDVLASGHVIWSYKFCPPPPCERMTFESDLDTDLLQLSTSNS